MTAAKLAFQLLIMIGIGYFVDQRRIVGSDFSADLNLAGCDLGIITVSADLSTLLDLAVSALLARFIILQDFDWHFAGVEASFTSLCRGFLELFTDFKLKSAALQVFIEALVGLNYFAHILPPPFISGRSP